MIKGQVVSGDFSKVLMRVKSGQQVELGEIVVVESPEVKYLLQIYDLAYGSQISQQNLEMVSGMNLEENNAEIMDETFRTYQLASCKPLINVGDGSKTCKNLPPFFAKIRGLNENDLSFITTPENPLFLGKIRCGSNALNFDVCLPGKEVLSHHVLVAASTGKGKSTLMKDILWNIMDSSYAGVLVLDPHDEYYGRVGIGLKDHSKRGKLKYYTPINPPSGAMSLKIHLSKIKPHHLKGAINLSDPQWQCLHAYYRNFKDSWVTKVFDRNAFLELKQNKVNFYEDTLNVVQRKLLSLLQLDYQNEEIISTGVFDLTAGMNTVSDICSELERGNVVVVDTSFFSGPLEIMMGSIIAGEMFEKYKSYKKQGILEQKPVVSIVLEEAPRVLGKKVLEQGSNIFDTLAREGRKFHVGLIAITQIPSEIPKNILANMNTKVILGMEMNSERQAVIESAPQDLSQDNRTISSLDKGEAIVTSTFTKFAVPIRIPLFSEYVKERKQERDAIELVGFS